MSKAQRLGIFFLLSRLIFVGIFFWGGRQDQIIIGFFLFLFTLLRSITDQPKELWRQYNKTIIAVGICIIIILGYVKNLYLGLSVGLVYFGTIYTIWYLYQDKYSNVIHSARGYAVFGLSHGVYIIAFAIASLLIGSTGHFDLDCSRIYESYQVVSTRFTGSEKTTSTSPQAYGLSFFQRMDNLTENYPQLQQLVHTIESYEQDISMGILDQQNINKEICVLVSNRINTIYNQGEVKGGLVLLIGLFLYPFMSIVFYVYGIISYIILKISIRYGFFEYKTRMIEKTELA